LSEPQPTYVPRLGLFDAAMAVVGGIIGGGIFLNPAVVAKQVGSAELVTIAWVLGGVVAVAGAFCFAELGARYPRAGGGYVYLREAFGPLPAFLYGWALLLVISTGALAFVASVFAQYTCALLGLDDGAIRPVAVAAVVVLSVINVFGVRQGAATQNVFTVLKLAALALIIGVGLIRGEASVAAKATTAPEGGWKLFTALGAALVPILFTYGGWQNTNFIAGEIRDAQRQLPRALLIGVGLVVLTYVTVNFAYIRALGVAGLAASKAPASDVMRAGLGETGATLVAAGIVASTFGFLSLVILTSPRVYQAMAADGLFFAQVARVHPRYRTPTIAIVIQGTWTVVVLSTGTYRELVNFVSFGDWIFFGLIGASLFVFRRRTSDRGLLFRDPFHPWTAVVFCAAALYAVISAYLESPTNSLLAGGIIAIGVPIYFVWRTRRGDAGAGTSPPS